MAKVKVKQPGHLCGVIGNVVACTWKGIPYLRSLPARVNDPKTRKQLAQRGRFSVALSLLRPLAPVLRLGFQEEAVRQTAFNAAMSHTMRHALEETEEGIAVNYRHVWISRGTLAGVPEARVTPGSGKAVFTWNASGCTGNASPRDNALLVAFHEPTQTAVYETSGTLRGEGRAELEYPKEWMSGDLAIYLGFCNQKAGLASISECLWCECLSFLHG